ncbi:MAG: hypothetical protein P4M11_07960 [Candidatus Pacebacteria bacterium]|nr:hypothetical protein [Candidatus Paceibacterota bacterium]
MPTMIDLLSLTSAQMKHAADLKEKIIALEQELASILGSPSTPAPAPEKKHKMSAAGRKRIAAGQKARWAKAHATKEPAEAQQIAAKPGRKPKRKMSALGRAAIAAAAKARWAKVKAEGKTSL